MSQAEPGSSLAGSIRIFRVVGITVYLHWSWALVAYLELQYRVNSYQARIWNVAEYLTFFLIVLLHEFGHALACRQVGGRANEIVLWPLGGIAYLSPPARPAALLWSIAAGPLVNIALVPLTLGILSLGKSQGWGEVDSDTIQFLEAVNGLNLGLLIFNLLPIYPLDGGQILQALLWFVVGRSTSLLLVSIFGLFAAFAIIVLAILMEGYWFIILAIFILFRSFVGFQQARALARLEQIPRHMDAVCPACLAHPLRGSFWTCDECQTPFDTFTQQAICPGCGKDFPQTQCPECLQRHPLERWYPPGWGD